MQILHLLVLPVLTSLLSLIICTPNKTSEYITEINDVTELLQELSDNHQSIILIYSPYCPHCNNFKPHYEKWSKEYNKYFQFYTINAIESTNYRTKFKINGYPTVFFYSNGTYSEYKGVNNFDFLSKYIDNNYIFNCTELNAEAVVNMSSQFLSNENSSNYVIGYFDQDNSKNSLLNNYIALMKKNNFISSITQTCFYCVDYGALKGGVSPFRNTIEAHSKQMGVNTFIEYRFIDGNRTDMIEKVNKNAVNFLYNSLKMPYDHVNTSTDYFDLSNHAKSLIIFTYNNEQVQNNYIKWIHELHAINNDIYTRPFDYVWFNINSNIKYISSKPFAKAVGIYLSDNKFKNITRLSDNLKSIKDIITDNQSPVKASTLSENWNSIFLENQAKVKKWWKSFIYNWWFFVMVFVLYSIIFIFVMKLTLYKTPERPLEREDEESKKLDNDDSDDIIMDTSIQAKKQINSGSLCKGVKRDNIITIE